MDEFYIVAVDAFEGEKAITAYKDYLHIIDTKQDGTQKGYQLQDGEVVMIQVHIKRSFRRMLSTTYLPSLCLIFIAGATFYFPEELFQARVVVCLTSMLVLSTLFGTTTRALPPITRTTFVEIWMMYAVLMTFVKLILHTIIFYQKGREKVQKEKEKAVANMVMPIQVLFTIKSPTSTVT